MTEYLIRTMAEHEWPAIHATRLAQVLVPRDTDWSPVQGWGDLRLRRGEVEVSFSGEMVGWQVAFDGPIADADARYFVDVVATQVEAEVDEPVEVLEL
jgi:hypothetical protein